MLTLECYLAVSVQCKEETHVSTFKLFGMHFHLIVVWPDSLLRAGQMCRQNAKAVSHNLPHSQAVRRC